MAFQISGSASREDCTIVVSPSKSISNRLLLIQALCGESMDIRNLATADDTLLLQKLLNSKSDELNAKNAGTVFRFLSAYLSIQLRTVTLTGSERMFRRPIGPLVDALNSLGAHISYISEKGFPPLKIEGRRISGGKVMINSEMSSQFVSALLLIAPLFENGLDLRLVGKQASKPYIHMTLELMKRHCVQSEWIGDQIRVQHQKYTGGVEEVEGDWSSASFWFLLCALSPGRNFTLNNLSESTLQGDAIIAKWMQKLGVRNRYEKDKVILWRDVFSNASQQTFLHFDFKDCPDLFPVMLVSCAALGFEAKFSSLQNLRLKESDRLTVMLHELSKCNFQYRYDESKDELYFPSQKLSPPKLEFSTHNDHRIAMALAPLSLLFDKIEMDDISVVQKSYPEYWQELEKIGFRVQQLNQN